LHILDTSTLQKYIAAFKELNRGNVPGSKEKAPHKVVLLLAVMAEIEAGTIAENRIYISDELVARFRDIWSRYVHRTNVKPDFYKPYYHLKGEGFWHLQAVPGREIMLTSSDSPKSFRWLKDSVLYAWLDPALYGRMQDAAAREVLQQTLLAAYFPHTATAMPGFFAEVEAQILHEAPVPYRQSASALDEEEVVARCGVFKRVIPRIYNYTCCISETRILAGPSVQMVDACHIVPFAESHDDTITNGLSLCPNLHRAFDRGLVKIDADYRVNVSQGVIESEAGYSLKQFDGKQILLPRNPEYWPGRENLARHWERWG
jgi:putative restriction endonuclease